MINLDIPVELIDNKSNEIDYSNLKNKILIGLCGYSKSGKDTIAKELVRSLGFRRISFADTLKEDMNEYFRLTVWEDLRSRGVDIDIELMDFLNPPTAEYKEILRPYMIWFGEKMKEINGPHHWTNRAFSKINETDRKLVITDVRRINELEIFKNSSLYQKIRNINRQVLGLETPSYYDIETQFEHLFLYVNQIHNYDDDILTQQTILKAMSDWMFDDTIYIDSRIQDISNYHEKHIKIQINKLVLKYPEYFI